MELFMQQGRNEKIPPLIIFQRILEPRAVGGWGIGNINKFEKTLASKMC